jgi:glycosyltransferase involved in cell wall biosynthesis
MTQPLVSILIPCRNSEKTVRQTIDSALMQDYPRLEVIVSDSGSSDGSVAIIKSYNDKRLRAYFHKDRARIDNYRGLYYDYAQGELCINVDSDDYLTDPSFITKAVAAFQANPGTVLVFAKTKILLDATGQLLDESVNDGLPAVMDGKWLFKVFPRGYTFPSLTCVHETQKARDVEIFSRDINSSDWEAFLKIILHGKVCFLQENVAVYRRHSGNATKTLNVEWIIDGADYVDGAYAYALRERLLPTATLDRWRLQLLKRYFLKQLVRVRILEQSQTEARLKEKLRERYPELSKEIMRDVRYKAFLLASKWKPIMRLGFKYYVKQEGFYEDLITSPALPEHHEAYHGLNRTAKRQ